jgi:uncharacterized protein (DUF2267 family)
MASRISMEALLGRLAEHGLSDEPAARRALEVTLAVLGERLTDDEAHVLVEVLPDELCVAIEDSEYDADFSTQELFERVRRRERSAGGRATETTEIVLMALGECLSPDRRLRIARGLPEKASGLLLGESNIGEPPPHRAAPHQSGPLAGRSLSPKMSTLASSRPGSAHPLSESAPPAGHTQSVAQSESPHAETKLSGAKGMTQERLEETLAAGRPPGPARPLSDSRSK